MEIFRVVPHGGAKQGGLYFGDNLIMSFDDNKAARGLIGAIREKNTAGYIKSLGSSADAVAHAKQIEAALAGSRTLALGETVMFAAPEGMSLAAALVDKAIHYFLGAEKITLDEALRRVQLGLIFAK